MLAPAQKAFFTLLERTMTFTSEEVSKERMAPTNPAFIQVDNALKSLSLFISTQPTLLSTFTVTLLNATRSAWLSDRTETCIRYNNNEINFVCFAVLCCAMLCFVNCSESSVRPHDQRSWFITTVRKDYNLNMRKPNKELGEFKQTYLSYRRQADSFLKDLPKLLSFSSDPSRDPSSDPSINFFAEVGANDIKTQREEKAVAEKLRDLHQNVDNLRQTLKYFEQSHEFLSRVQGISQKTLQKMDNFKSKMASTYDELAGQQDRLVADLQMCSRKIEAIATGTIEDYNKENGKKNDREKKNKDGKRDGKGEEKAIGVKVDQPVQDEMGLQTRMRNKEEECQKLERQIAGLGRHLGWSEQDHGDFVVIWNKHAGKNYLQIEEELKGYFSFYTGQQVREHMNKHIRGKQLYEAKKQCIYQYKLLKEERKREEYEALQEQESHSHQMLAAEAGRRREEQQQRLLKAQVEIWRQAKLNSQQEQARKAAHEQARKKQLQIEKRNQILLRNKEILDEWKDEKEGTKRESVTPSVKKVDPETEARIKEREQQLVQKRVEAVIAKKRELEMQAQKEEELKERKQVKYSYVSSKVQQKTTAVKEKQRQKFDGKQPKDACTFGGNLLLSGARATPAWMKGI